MHNLAHRFLFITVLCLIVAGCSKGDAQKNTTADSPRPVATPSKNFTPADVAKLKWIEGSWRGMDGDKPFYERYKLEETALVVEALKEDGTPDGEPGRFELKNGEFGKGDGNQRSAASEITDSFIQFVPAPATASSNTNANSPKPVRNSFRFEKQSDGTWIALLEWQPSGDKPAQAKVYKMEPWPKK